MACEITTGRAKLCHEGQGGNKAVYIFNYLEDPFTIVAGVATAINVALTVVYKFYIEGDLNTYAQDVQPTNIGSTVNTQTLTVNLPNQTATDSANLNLLAYGSAMAVIEDRNGVYHAAFVDDGALWQIQANTGGAKAEGNGYTVIALGTTGALAPQLDAGTITAFLALV